MNEKSIRNRKAPSETELVKALENGQIALSPLKIFLEATEPIGGVDGVMTVAWNDKRCAFAFEYKAQSTPRAIERAQFQVERYTKGSKLLPLIVVPFLSPERLETLEAEGFSGLDLSGNAMIKCPEFYFWKSGAPNKFKQNQPIKNVFKGRSSLIVRALLLEPQAATLTELRGNCQARFKWPLQEKWIKGGLPPEYLRLRGEGYGIQELRFATLPTVSKVVKALEEQLMVTTEGGGVKLLEPGKVLDELSYNFRQPEVTRRVQGKVVGGPDEVWSAIYKSMYEDGTLEVVPTGMSSVNRYSAMAVPNRLSLYVTKIDPILADLPFVETQAFPDVEFIETQDETVYFDMRGDSPADWWASPIQTFLELSRGTSRDRETAQQIKNSLVAEIKEKSPWTRS